MKGKCFVLQIKKIVTIHRLVMNLNIAAVDGKAKAKLMSV